MTRYDPFAFGEVRLDSKKEPSEDGPDDMLFADGGPVKQAPPADSSWSLLDEDVDDLLPGKGPGQAVPEGAIEFGAEILGESLPQEPAKPQRAKAGTRSSEGEVATAGPIGPGERRTLRRRPLAVPGGAGAKTAGRKVIVPTRRRRPVMSVLLPLLMCGGGGTAASWFWVMKDNPVMAAIVGTGTLVGALFAWLLLRG